MKHFSRLFPVLVFALGNSLAFAADPPECPIANVPQAEFISVAKKVVDLIANVDPSTAEHHFKQAKAFFTEPALSEFDNVMLGDELRTIRETKRSQTFTYSDDQVKIEIFESHQVAVVRITGTRHKTIRTKALPPDDIRYYVKMKLDCKDRPSAMKILVADVRLRVGSVPAEQPCLPTRTAP